MLETRPDPKYSPLTVAAWLEGFTAIAGNALASYRKESTQRTSPEYRRWEEDILIQLGLGRFFAAKLRAGVAFEIFLKSGDVHAGETAVQKYTEARDAWATMSQRAAEVYKTDIGYGSTAQRRGHWTDRLPAIDTDLAAMRAAVKTPSASSSASGNIPAALRYVNLTPPRAKVNATHVPPTSFTPGQAQTIRLTVDSSVASAELYFRHVNQGERWNSVAMTKNGNGFVSAIPSEYTKSVYPLQYYFVVRRGTSSSYHPEFNETLSNEPYFAIWHRS